MFLIESWNFFWFYFFLEFRKMMEIQTDSWCNTLEQSLGKLYEGTNDACQEKLQKLYAVLGRISKFTCLQDGIRGGSRGASNNCVGEQLGIDKFEIFLFVCARRYSRLKQALLPDVYTRLRQ